MQLKQVLYKLVVNHSLGLGIVTNTRAYVSVQNGICKAQVILIALTAQSVRRSLIHQINGQTQLTADSLNLGNGKSAKRSKIAGGIAVTG